MIHSLRANYCVTELCEALEVSTSGYYRSIYNTTSNRSISNQHLLSAMKSIHSHRHTRSYGSLRMTHQLRSLGLGCSKNRIAPLMRIHNLRASFRKPFTPKTTRPDHAANPSPNLLALESPLSAPATHLVRDITYMMQIVIFRAKSRHVLLYYKEPRVVRTILSLRH